MTRYRFLVGDVRETLSTLPDDSAQCVVTSPPYWGLRDYGTATWARERIGAVAPLFASEVA
jgi:DNA modification methylase